MFSLFKKVENNVTKLLEMPLRKHPRNFLFTSKPFQRIFWQNFDLTPLRNIILTNRPQVSRVYALIYPKILSIWKTEKK